MFTIQIYFKKINVSGDIIGSKTVTCVKVSGFRPEKSKLPDHNRKDLPSDDKL